MTTRRERRGGVGIGRTGQIAVLLVAALAGSALLFGQGTIRTIPARWIDTAVGLWTDRPVGIGTSARAGTALALPDGTKAAPALAFGSDPDVGLYRPGANQIGLVAGTGLVTWNSATFNVVGTTTGDVYHRLTGSYSGYVSQVLKSEVISVAAAATTDSVTNLLPANAVIDAVLWRVTTAIPAPATTFTVGDATQPARFATTGVVAAGSTGVGLLHKNPTVASDDLGPVQTAAAKLRLTFDAPPGDATGRIRVIVIYRVYSAPVG